MGRPSKENAKLLGGHVLAVADALFIEHGYSATSIGMVAARARVGKPTIYRRFRCKATLFREVINRRIDAIVSPVGGAIAEEGPLCELRALGHAALDMVFDPDFVRLNRMIVAEAVLFPELACAASDIFRSSFTERCVEAIRRAQLQGMCRPGNPKTLADCFLWSLVGDSFLKALSGQQRQEITHYPNSHLELVWRVFLDGVAVEPEFSEG